MPTEAEIEAAARAICKTYNVDPDGTTALVTYRYDADHPKGIMQIGRYEEGWDWKDPTAQPRNPNGTKTWQWFTEDARAALEGAERVRAGHEKTPAG